MPLVGGVASAIVTGRVGITFIATPTQGAAAGSIFWVEFADPIGTTSRLMRRNVGGQIITVLPNVDSYFAVDDDKVFSEQAGALVQVSIDGGPATVLATAQQASYPWGIAVDSTYVYWSTFGGKIVRLPRLGATEVVWRLSSRRSL